LAELYAGSERLRSLVNLVIVGGVIDPDTTIDREEASECVKMHEIIEKYKMQDCCRWIVAQKNRVRNGELYRFIADTHGAFVQPALYEAFGLTVVEAMTCGLPVFGTRNGGPAEVIKRGTGKANIPLNFLCQYLTFSIHLFLTHAYSAITNFFVHLNGYAYVYRHTITFCQCVNHWHAP
jgi:sucrose synthase